MCVEREIDFVVGIASELRRNGGNGLDRSVYLAEALLLVASSGVGDEDRVLSLDGDVVLEGQVGQGQFIRGPLAENFYFSSVRALHLNKLRKQTMG